MKTIAELKSIFNKKGKKILLITAISDKKSMYQGKEYLCLEYLKGSVLKNTDWQVETLNSYGKKTGIAKKDLLKKLKEFKPSIVGITATSAEHFDAIKTLQIVKKFDKKIILIKGGTHETACFKDTLEKYNLIDFCFAGDADLSLPAFLNCFNKDFNFSGIDGLTYKKGGKIIGQIRYLTPQDFEFLDFPRPKMLEQQKWIVMGNKKTARVMASRGCNKGCVFCSSVRPVRYMPVDKIIKHLEELWAFGFNSVFFEDLTFSLDRARTIKLLNEMIKLREKGINLGYGCQTRYDCLDDELIRLMKRANFVYLYMAVESLDENVLQKINKCITAGQIKKMLEKINKSGIKQGVTIVRGFMGDTKESFEKTVNQLYELEPAAIFCEMAKVYPNTGLSKIIGEQKVIDFYHKKHNEKLQNPEDEKQYLLLSKKEVIQAYGKLKKILCKKGKYLRKSAGFYILKNAF